MAIDRNLADWYFTVNDSSPATQVWASARGVFVGIADASFHTWLQGSGNVFGFNIPITGAADNGSGKVRLTLGGAGTGTTPLQWTTGAEINVIGTGSYDGLTTMTVIDASHIDLPSVNFTGSVTTGSVLGAEVVDTLAHLGNQINIANQALLSSGAFAGIYTQTVTANTTLTNPIKLTNVIKTTTGAWLVGLPIMDLVGSIPIGAPFIMQNDPTSTFQLEFTYNDGTLLPNGAIVLGPGQSLMLEVSANLSKNGTIDALALLYSGIYPESIGGTGTTTFSNHGTIFQSGSALSSSVGSSGQVWLQVSGNNPAWNTLGGDATINSSTAALTLTNVPAPVTIAGAATVQGDLIYASAAATLARLAKNASATRYLANTGASNNPAWSQVDLTNGVTGTLPIASGGTNDTGTAWASWSPTFSASGGGSFTTVTLTSAQYKMIGKTLWFNINFTLANIGTASGNVRFTLPTAQPASDGCLVFREVAVNGRFGGGVYGPIRGDNTTQIQYYDGSVGGTVVASAQYICSGTYEAP